MENLKMDMEKTNCTRTLRRGQHRFQTIQTFARIFGTQLMGLTDSVHFPAVKSAVDVGGSTSCRNL
jgi:hypothetical protein